MSVVSYKNIQTSVGYGTLYNCDTEAGLPVAGLVAGADEAYCLDTHSAWCASSATTWVRKQTSAVGILTGATQLTVGTIADGEFLKRSGTTIISEPVTGATPSIARTLMLMGG